MKVRWYLPALLGVTLVGAGVAFWRMNAPSEPEIAPSAGASAPLTPDQQQEERRRPVVEVAPAPIPDKMPLLGPEGTSADGYPLAYVDGAGFRSLLWHERWADLDRYFDELQKAFEEDPKREYWPYDAARAFDSAEASLTKKLDRWIRARPESWAARLSRGMHWYAVGWANRGGKYAAETARTDMEDMRRAFDNARLDFDAALAMRPKLMAAFRAQLAMAAALGDGGGKRAALDKGLAACPTCIFIRAAFLAHLRPRWGGSHEEMRTFARSCNATVNPRCRFLEGYIDDDIAVGAMERGDLDEAERAMDRALALGEWHDFYDTRAMIRVKKKFYSGALEDATKAVTLRPGNIEFRIRRAQALVRMKRWEEAGKDMLDALRVQPTDSFAKDVAPDVVNGLIYAAWAAYRAGQRDDALRIYDLAAELAPTERRVIGGRAAAILGTETPDIAALEEAVRKAPDDLRLHQQLDYALAKERKFERIAEVWTDYLSRHPEEGRAYMERAGTYHHLRRREESRSDAARACELGITEGCIHAK
jgi:tetratricopeptide (TPR) repeat protein